MTITHSAADLRGISLANVARWDGDPSKTSQIVSFFLILHVEYLPTWDPKRWSREAALRDTLRGRYHGVCADVQKLSDRVVRARFVRFALFVVEFCLSSPFSATPFWDRTSRAQRMPSPSRNWPFPAL